MSDPAPLFAARPWLADPPGLLGAAAAVPAMLTDEERAFYRWLAATWAEGRGEVVDLGCFVGGSTACLAAGHRAAGHAGLIHAYDFFTVSDSLKRRLLYPAGIAPFEGEDMLTLARDLLCPWEDRVTFCRGDILARRWPADEPIEILVIDAAKSDRLADHIAATFFPALIPGRSVVVQQDFLHGLTPWLPAQMELLAGCFAPLVHVPGDSVSFLCTRVPDAATLAAARIEGRDYAALTALLTQAESRLAGVVPPGRIASQARRLAANPGIRVSWQFPRD